MCRTCGRSPGFLCPSFSNPRPSPALDARRIAVDTGFISQFFEEIAPTLLPVPGVDTKTYQKKLVERFGELRDHVYTLSVCIFGVLTRRKATRHVTAP